MRHPTRPSVLPCLAAALLAAGCPAQTASSRDEPRDPQGPLRRTDPAPRPGSVAPGPGTRAATARRRASAAPAAPRPAAPRLGAADLARIDRLFARYAGEQPGASVILLKDGQVLASRSYGYADLARRLPATNRTRYRTASVTKQFTAMAVMLLVADGKLSYETTLTEVFPDFPDYGRRITMAHLLRHRSGLVEYLGLLRRRRTPILDRGVLALMKAQRRTLFPPGTRYRYSNSGYAVLAEVVAKVSGDSFAAFLQRRVFGPLGMRDSGVVGDGATKTGWAVGYVRAGARWVQKDQCASCDVQGDGGVYTSVADYARWDRALAAGTLLPAAAWREALTSWHDSPSLQVQRYGHGWRIDDLDTARITHHSGHTLGFTNHTLRIPSRRVTFAAFTNRGGEDAVIRIGDTLAALHGGADLPVPIVAFVEAAFDATGTTAALETFRQYRTRRDRRYRVDENALLVVGRKLQRQGRLKEAIRVHRANLEAFPGSFLSWFELASCHHRLGASGPATAAYRKALRLVPPLYRTVFETATLRLRAAGAEPGAPPRP